MNLSRYGIDDKNFNSLMEALHEVTRYDLEEIIVNTYYNDFIREWIDDGYRAKLSCDGFWPNVDFYNLNIYIENKGGTIYFIPNLNQGYIARKLTGAEALTVVQYLDEAIKEQSSGDYKFYPLNKYMQSLTI